ncbi:hypothetical protein AMAG_13399 [Allomyces macrogynus ATCC 38327]|uniref:N-acetyltransferase domain-containing protein n=1 Tax=Allomyces macrogynus (strain ATCC 38327) TaxID=578462 RepID=A0A0L0T2E9_ALLM3|nr:hypothetical protein AMAG_13399 [Allomyces macrogynus ATCC 38327]|eukprot:KNE68759.1 hypothetical protein AMAG_13399 [Allomyces macrogynus ATCC 38327]
MNRLVVIPFLLIRNHTRPVPALARPTAILAPRIITTMSVQARYVDPAAFDALVTSTPAAIATGFPADPELRVRLATPDDAQAIVHLTNLAYVDARWFKAPSFYNRAILDEVLEEVDAPESCFLVLDWPVASVAQPANDESTSTPGAQGVPLAASVQVHLDKPSGKPLFGMLAVHPNVHRRGVAKTMVRAVEALVRRVLKENTLVIEVVSVQPHLLEIYGKMGFVAFQERKWEEFGIDPAACLVVPCHLIALRKTLAPEEEEE